MSACIYRHNNVVAKAKKIKCHFFLSFGVLLTVEAKNIAQTERKKHKPTSTLDIVSYYI